MACPKKWAIGRRDGDEVSVPRSYLYVPGDRPDRMDKAARSDADALILDLEDSVAPSHKDEARAAVARWLGSVPADHPQLWVRVNSESVSDDVAAVASVAGSALAGIVVPKASPALLASAAATLARREREKAVPPGTIALLPLIETARGMLALAEIAAAERVARLGIGAADLSAELGIRYGDGDLRRLSPLLLQVVLASAVAGLPGPIAPISTDFRDLVALRTSTVSLRDNGFRSRTCIHPAQLAVVNEAFTPTPDELERAREVVAAFDAAVSRGSGVLTGADGRMIDEAVVRHAREVIGRARRDSRHG